MTSSVLKVSLFGEAFSLRDMGPWPLVFGLERYAQNKDKVQGPKARGQL